MKYEALRKEVCRINKEIVPAGLVVLTWGNASGVDRDKGVVAIKPSGVGYDALKPRDIVVVSLASGDVVAGSLRPSSDTPTHLCLYQAFAGLGGIVHTHSTFATGWAQARKPIPCQGTTHADHFYGAIPVARECTAEEIATAYERHTGDAIVDTFRTGGLDPMRIPGVLVPGHAPFAWGPTPQHALDNAVVLEEVARLAWVTQLIDPNAGDLPRTLLDKHFLRKHGDSAYYGQASGQDSPKAE